MFQGGDGLFNEILNGLLLSRHKASYPARPANANQSVENTESTDNSDGNNLEVSDRSEDNSPLLTNSGHNGSQVMNLSMLRAHPLRTFLFVIF